MGETETPRLHVSDPRVQEAGLIIWYLNRHPDEHQRLLTLANMERTLAILAGETGPYVRCAECGEPMEYWREDGTPACEEHQ